MNVSDEQIACDAASRLDTDRSDVTVSRHIQIFPSTTCGFPGVGGHALTHAEVAVATVADGGACVYTHGRLCYVVREPNDLFREALAAERLASAGRYREEYELNPNIEELFNVAGSQLPPTSFAKAINRAMADAWPGDAPKAATVIRVSDGAVVCTATPREGQLPDLEFSAAAEAYRFENRFPRVDA